MTTDGYPPPPQNPHLPDGPGYGAPQGGPYGFPGQGFGDRGFGDQGFGGRTPAGLLPRLGARMLDSLVVGLPMGLLTFVVALSTHSFVYDLLMSALTGAVAFGYWTYFESTRGTTPGKKLLGLSVVGPDGGRPTFEQAAKRNAFEALQILTGVPLLGWVADLIYLIVCIGIAVTIGQNPSRQGFHDVFAGGTRVVRS